MRWFLFTNSSDSRFKVADFIFAYGSARLIVTTKSISVNSHLITLKALRAPAFRPVKDVSLLSSCYYLKFVSIEVPSPSVSNFLHYSYI